MNRDVLLTGTGVIEPASRILRAGALEARFDAGALRWIRWNGVELLRAVMFLVRTPGWGTPAPTIAGLDIREEAGAFTVSYDAHYGEPGAGLQAGIRLTGEAAGRLRAEAKIRAEAPFETNRTGFVILHPLDGFAGTSVHVDHASAPARDLTIPARISPGQPVMDMRAITHAPTEGLTVETRFDGDVFEMEDHRNWSDASFKTYSRPIGLPYPYKLTPEEPVIQSVTVTVTDRGARGAPVPAVSVPALSGRKLPGFALPLDRLADADAVLALPERMAALAPRWLLLRHDATREAAEADLSPLARALALTGAALEVQAILASDSDAEAEAEIAALAGRFGAAGIAVARIGAFAKVDERSFQPGEPRPPHPSESAIAASLTRHFPRAARIGGTPAFFTEFNRKRPDPSLWQGLSFATTPTVHAADDASVMETLQSLPHILASATALAGGLPLSVGPTGIGARLNPYGPGPSMNAPETREGMAARDPRQRGLFAAAWIVGYLARIAPFAPERFAFGAPAGPFGLISTRQDHARPFWDDLGEGCAYPLYHVARLLSGAAGAELEAAETSGGIARLVWRREGRRHELLANLTSGPQPLPDNGPARALVMLLDAGSVADLARDPALAEPRARDLPKVLDAYAVLHLVAEEGTQ